MTDTHPVAKQAVQMLIKELLQGVALVLPELNSHDTCAVVCAMAQLSAFDGPLLRAISDRALTQVQELTSFNVAGLLWAFST